MRRAIPVTRTSSVADDRQRRSRALAELGALAWLLDNSIPVPLTGGRRFGLDALIGFVPVVGDLASGAIGLLLVWRGSRMGLPRIVVARMLANTTVDMAVGVIPMLGDAFDLWFKANTRNLDLMRRHVERPGTSTRDDWLVVTTMAGIVIAVIALAGWMLVSLVAAVVGLFA
jgi:hypothetical protein